jgi:hypothetical protein
MAEKRCGAETLANECRASSQNFSRRMKLSFPIQVTTSEVSDKSHAFSHEAGCIRVPRVDNQIRKLPRKLVAFANGDGREIAPSLEVKNLRHNASALQMQIVSGRRSVYDTLEQ